MDEINPLPVTIKLAAVGGKLTQHKEQIDEFVGWFRTVR